jgi:hypothetical protein
MGKMTLARRVDRRSVAVVPAVAEWNHQWVTGLGIRLTPFREADSDLLVRSAYSRLRDDA